MDIKQLSQAAKEYCADPEKMKAMQERAREAGKRFEQQAKDRRPNADFWRRVYDC